MFVQKTLFVILFWHFFLIYQEPQKWKQCRPISYFSFYLLGYSVSGTKGIQRLKIQFLLSRTNSLELCCLTWEPLAMCDYSNKLKIQFLSRTSHTSRAQYPHVASVLEYTWRVPFYQCRKFCWIMLVQKSCGNHKVEQGDFRLRKIMCEVSVRMTWGHVESCQRF